MTMQTCPQCKDSLPHTSDYFYRNKTKKSGLNTLCKRCQKKNSAKRYRNLAYSTDAEKFRGRNFTHVIVDEYTTKSIDKIIESFSPAKTTSIISTPRGGTLYRKEPFDPYGYLPPDVVLNPVDSKSKNSIEDDEDKE